jgi:hypothetical protein
LPRFIPQILPTIAPKTYHISPPNLVTHTFKARGTSHKGKRVYKRGEKNHGAIGILSSYIREYKHLFDFSNILSPPPNRHHIGKETSPPKRYPHI